MDVRFVAGVYGLERLTEIVKQSCLIVFVEQNVRVQSEIFQLRVADLHYLSFTSIQISGCFKNKLSDINYIYNTI